MNRAVAVSAGGVMTKAEISEAVRSSESVELSAEERGKKSGSFIALPCGTTHYELKGEGRAVVLVHGYATPYYIYDKIFYALTSAGYRVLRYDLLGRGYSERVRAKYDPALFARQLDELTAAVLGDEPFLLVGTSMGGAVCAEFYRRHPEKVEALVLLAPAGMDTFKPPLYMRLCRIKGLGEALFYNVAGKMLLKKCASELYHVSEAEKDYYERSFADACRYKGFLRCTLSSLRNTILNTGETVKGYRAIGEGELPALCIWGTGDKTMPYYQSERFSELCGRAKLITYNDSGHVFLFDEGERTAKDILSFFAANGV